VRLPAFEQRLDMAEPVLPVDWSRAHGCREQFQRLVETLLLRQQHAQIVQRLGTLGFSVQQGAIEAFGLVQAVSLMRGDSTR